MSCFFFFVAILYPIKHEIMENTTIPQENVPNSLSELHSEHCGEVC
jgi:hypothetical protein